MVCTSSVSEHQGVFCCCVSRCFSVRIRLCFCCTPGCSGLGRIVLRIEAFSFRIRVVCFDIEIVFLCSSRCAKLRIKVFLFAQPRAFLCVQGAHVCVFLCASMCAHLCIKVFLFAHPSVFRCVQGAHVCATRWFVVRPALFLLAHHGVVFFAHRAVSFCITVFSLRAKVFRLAQCFRPSCWLALHIGVYFSFAVEV